MGIISILGILMSIFSGQADLTWMRWLFAGTLALSSLFVWWWAVNGYLVCRIDLTGVTLGQRKSVALIEWGRIAFCEVVTPYNVFGMKGREYLRFLDRDRNLLDKVSLNNTAAKEQTIFLEHLNQWFGERSETPVQPKEMVTVGSHEYKTDLQTETVKQSVGRS